MITTIINCAICFVWGYKARTIVDWIRRGRGPLNVYGKLVLPDASDERWKLTQVNGSCRHATLAGIRIDNDGEIIIEGVMIRKANAKGLAYYQAIRDHWAARCSERLLLT